MRAKFSTGAPGQQALPSCPKALTTSWPLMEGEMAWDGSDFQTCSQYTLHLTAQDNRELEDAVSDFEDLDLAAPDVDRNNFVLPTLGKTLESCSLDLHDGRGFFVVRGLDPQKYSPEVNLILFLGIASYIGDNRGKQDDRGNMVAHLHHDAKRHPVSGAAPTRLSNKEASFHTDLFSDILCLHVRSLAAGGGAFKIASSWNIYNKLAASRPDLVEAMAGLDWKFARRNKLFPACQRPLLFCHDGRIILNFSRRPLLAGQSSQDGPHLSQIQHEALKEIQKIATESQLILDTQPGDMVFVNNHALLHSRDAFRDDEVQARHVVRLWLRNTELAWTLPPALERGNRKVFYENTLRERWAVSVGSYSGSVLDHANDSTSH